MPITCNNRGILDYSLKIDGRPVDLRRTFSILRKLLSNAIAESRGVSTDSKLHVSRAGALRLQGHSASHRPCVRSLREWKNSAESGREQVHESSGYPERL